LVFYTGIQTYNFFFYLKKNLERAVAHSPCSPGSVGPAVVAAAAATVVATKGEGLVVQGRAWPYDALSRHTLWQNNF
jgi:hypothetical protein